LKIEEINAVTLGTHDMPRAVAFYRALGFELAWASATGDFSVFRAGRSYLNLVRVHPATQIAWWGRVIFHVEDVDVAHATAIENGLTPASAPQDAAWGERYFHIIDPDGHELSFARRLNR